MTRPIVLATCARWPALSASDECLAAALRARGWRVEAAPAPALYARVDGLLVDGRLMVMEVQVNEPGLGLDLVPGAADRFAQAMLARLA